jgi:hypothetical protein
MFDNSYTYRLGKRDFYRDLMESYGPYRFVLTLPFQRRISVDDAIDRGGIFWRRMTKKVFQKDRRIPFSSIHGQAVLERASITKAQDALKNVNGYENPHFHMLIKDHSVFSKDEDLAIQQLQDASWKAARNLKNYCGLPLVSSEEVDVRSVYSDGILEYLTKDSTDRGWKREERIFYLDSEGFESVGERNSWQMF